MGLGTGATGSGVGHFLLSCRTFPKCNAFETPFIFSELLFTVPCVVGVKASQKLMKQKVAWLNASHGVKVKHFLQHIHKNNLLHSFLLLKRRDLETTTRTGLVLSVCWANGQICHKIKRKHKHGRCHLETWALRSSSWCPSGAAPPLCCILLESNQQQGGNQHEQQTSLSSTSAETNLD